MFQDLRYAIRLLFKNPGFSAVVVATLAFGIGANAALFSIVNGVLLNPLTFPEPDQLVTIHQSKPNFDAGAMPYPNFLDLQRENQTFTAMSLSTSANFSLLGAGEAERVSGRLITADLFTALGVTPALGRTFVPADDKSDAGPVALISAGLWSRKFNSSPTVLENKITLDDKTYSVVGVLPASFNLFRDVDVYVPLGQWGRPALKSRSAALGLHGIGRLKPGVTLEQAQADLNRIMANLAVAYPATNKGNGAKLIALKEQVVGYVRPILLMLMGAVAFVLLIAAVNVSNLMLARSTGRTREFAIRTALGANKSHLVKQALIESTVLALIGGALGLSVAAWATRLALAALPTSLPRADEVGVDLRVLAFTVIISLLTGIAAGLAPALKSSGRTFNETLKQGGRTGTGGRVRAQGAFVAVQMALALVLLIGAGLTIRSLKALWQVDPGFKSENVLTFSLSLPPSLQTATPNTIRTTLRQLSDRLAAIPGAQAVSLSDGASPLQGEDDRFFWLADQPRPQSTSQMNMTLFYIVEPGYLSTMGIALKQGRFFTNQDDERAPQVAVIDEVFARKYYPGSNPIGRYINLGDDDRRQIVGVVGHVKQWGLDTDDEERLQAQLYVPFRSASDNELTTTAVGVIRSGADIETDSTPLVNSIRHVAQVLNSQNIVSRPKTMNQVIAGSLAQKRFSMIVLGTFASVALLLASLGIYGVISYLVGQQTQELGIRIALGAGRRDILALVLGRGMKMALAGVGAGLIAAFGLTRLMSSLLFGVRATDPLTFVAIAVLLTVVASLACYLPARRATKVDPLEALRTE